MLPFVERTLVLIKPDAVKRCLVGEIIARFERAGLHVVALKMIQPSLEHARQHYPITDAQLVQMGSKSLATYASLNLDPVEVLGTADPKQIGALIHDWCAGFLSSGPIVACVIQGVHAIRKVRAICGATVPSEALPGTIRGDFSCASPAVANLLKSAVYNLVHASDNALNLNEPTEEIEHWFKAEEIVNYLPAAYSAMFAPEVPHEAR